MRRVLNSTWFPIAVGGTVGVLLVAVLAMHGMPSSDDAVETALLVFNVGVAALPFLVLLPWHFVARRRGLIPRSRVPHHVAVAEGVLTVEHGATRVRCDLREVSRARRVCNDNCTASTMLEDAIGLFSPSGHELLRLPLSAAGIDALDHALRQRGIHVDDVSVSAPAGLD